MLRSSIHCWYFLTLFNNFRLCLCLHFLCFILDQTMAAIKITNHQFLDIIFTISLQYFMIRNLMIQSLKNSLLTFPSSEQWCYYFLHLLRTEMMTIFFFASSVCKSLHVSCVVESIYEVILLLHHPHLCSNSQNRAKITPSNRFTLGRSIYFDTMSKNCIVLFQTI